MSCLWRTLPSNLGTEKYQVHVWRFSWVLFEASAKSQTCQLNLWPWVLSPFIYYFSLSLLNLTPLLLLSSPPFIVLNLVTIIPFFSRCHVTQPFHILLLSGLKTGPCPPSSDSCTSSETSPSSSAGTSASEPQSDSSAFVAVWYCHTRAYLLFWRPARSVLHITDKAHEHGLSTAVQSVLSRFGI